MKEATLIVKVSRDPYYKGIFVLLEDMASKGCLIARIINGKEVFYLDGLDFSDDEI